MQSLQHFFPVCFWSKPEYLQTTRIMLMMPTIYAAGSGLEERQAIAALCTFAPSDQSCPLWLRFPWCRKPQASPQSLAYLTRSFCSALGHEVWNRTLATWVPHCTQLSPSHTDIQWSSWQGVHSWVFGWSSLDPGQADLIQTCRSTVILAQGLSNFYSSCPPTITWNSTA